MGGGVLYTAFFRLVDHSYGNDDKRLKAYSLQLIAMSLSINNVVYSIENGCRYRDKPYKGNVFLGYARFKLKTLSATHKRNGMSRTVK